MALRETGLRYGDGLLNFIEFFNNKNVDPELFDRMFNTNANYLESTGLISSRDDLPDDRVFALLQMEGIKVNGEVIEKATEVGAIELKDVSALEDELKKSNNMSALAELQKLKDGNVIDSNLTLTQEGVFAFGVHIDPDNIKSVNIEGDSYENISSIIPFYSHIGTAYREESGVEGEPDVIWVVQSGGSSEYENDEGGYEVTKTLYKDNEWDYYATMKPLGKQAEDKVIENVNDDLLGTPYSIMDCMTTARYLFALAGFDLPRDVNTFMEQGFLDAPVFHEGDYSYYIEIYKRLIKGDNDSVVLYDNNTSSYVEFPLVINPTFGNNLKNILEKRDDGDATLGPEDWRFSIYLSISNTRYGQLDGNNSENGVTDTGESDEDQYADEEVHLPKDLFPGIGAALNPENVVITLYDEDGNIIEERNDHGESLLETESIGEDEPDNPDTSQAFNNGVRGVKDGPVIGLPAIAELLSREIRTKYPDISKSTALLSASAASELSASMKPILPNVGMLPIRTGTLLNDLLMKRNPTFIEPYAMNNKSKSQSVKETVHITQISSPTVDQKESDRKKESQRGLASEKYNRLIKMGIA